MSHYFQWSDDIEKHLRHLETVLLLLRGKRVLVAADANERSHLWGPKDQRANSRGRKLESLINSFEIDGVNRVNEGPTYSTTQVASYIDVTLASQSIARLISDKQWRVRDSWTSSDHNAIDIRLQVPEDGVREHGKNALQPGAGQRFDTKRADWDRFVGTLKSLSKCRLEEPTLTNKDEVEIMAGTFTSVLLEACTESMPRKRRYRVSSPRWTKELTQFKKKTYASRRTYQEELRSQERRKEMNGVLLSQLKVAYRSSMHTHDGAIKSAKRESWRNFVTSHGNKEPWGFVYKHPANELRIERVISTLRRDGIFTRDIRVTASFLLDTHVPDDRVEDDTPHQKEIRKSARKAPEAPDAPQITDEEVNALARTMKNGKAPGPDLIEVEVLKTSCSNITGQTTRLFNSCLKLGVFPTAWKESFLRVLLKGEYKDVADPKSYRPLCILSVIGKLFEKAP